LLIGLENTGGQHNDGRVSRFVHLTQTMNKFNAIEERGHANTRHDDIGRSRQRERICGVSNDNWAQSLEAKIVRIHLSVISGIFYQ